MSHLEVHKNRTDKSKTFTRGEWPFNNAVSGTAFEEQSCHKCIFYWCYLPYSNVAACSWTLPLQVCNWKSAEELTALLVWNVACNLGSPLSLGLLFCLPISNASLKDTKVNCFSHFAILAFKDTGLSNSVFSSLLFYGCPLYMQPLWHGCQFAFYFLPANPHSLFFFFLSHMQTYSVLQMCFLSATFEIQYELPWINLFHFTWWLYIPKQFLQHYSALLISLPQRDLFGVNKNSTRFQ